MTDINIYSWWTEGQKDGMIMVCDGKYEIRAILQKYFES